VSEITTKAGDRLDDDSGSLFLTLPSADDHRRQIIASEGQGEEQRLEMGARRRAVRRATPASLGFKTTGIRLCQFPGAQFVRVVVMM